jgi:cold shock CspA family protein
MHFGTVLSFSPDTGHGLIAPDGDTRPVSVSHAAIAAAGLGQLAERQRVGFDIAADGAAPTAVNLWTTWSGR